MNERIRQLRKSLGLTLEEFGAKVGVGKTAISNIENGKRNLTEQMFKSICREWNVNEEWLRTGEGEMFVEMDKEDLLMQWAGKMLGDETDSFKRNFVKVLMSLTESEWKFLEDKARELLDCRQDK